MEIPGQISVETKGKTLEEIEHPFEGKSAVGAPGVGAA
jgi:hypothetical protein